MSLLKNPGFEVGSEFWFRSNKSEAVSFSIDKDPSIAKSGEKFLRMRTSSAAGSIAQDFTSKAPSVSALAYVKAAGASVSGTMALWDLNAGVSSSTRFTVGQQWTLLANMLGTGSGIDRKIRVEFYLDTPNADLLIDSVTAF